MKFFQRSKVPKWAKPLTAEEYQLFREKLLVASSGKLDPGLADKNGAVKHDLGMAAIKNLLSLISGRPTSEWDAEIERWVRVVTLPPDDMTLSYPEDISLLRIQMYPSNYFAESESAKRNAIIRELVPGILMTIVVDTPDSVFTLSTEKNPKFVEHEDEVFSKLIEGISQQTPYPVEHVEMGEGGVVAVIENGDIMAATHVLAFDRLYPQLVGKHGALVGLPSRHMILVKRLDAPADPRVVGFMKGAAKYCYDRASPGGLSPEVYKYRDEKISPLRGEI